MRIGESTADEFATLAMVQYMKSRAMRGADALKFVSNASQLLCGTGQDDVHPTGNFRISFLLGENPEIRGLLGCPVSYSARPGCTFNGFGNGAEAHDEAVGSSFGACDFLSSGTLLAKDDSPRTENLPQMTLTRYLSPAGVESLSLFCHVELCYLVRRKNGRDIAAVEMKAVEIKTMLARFFEDLPKVLPKFSERENADPVLGWQVRYENKSSEGTVPRFELEKSGDVKRVALCARSGTRPSVLQVTHPPKKPVYSPVDLRL